MIAAFCTALASTVVVFAILGTGETGTLEALAVSARISFFFFWLAYAGSPLARLFGPAFQPLRQRGRELGLAFASAHLVHVGLLLWLYAIGAPPPIGTFYFFGVGLVFLYLLALLSVDRLRQAIGGKAWWLLRTVGMNYIALAFAVDFLRHPTASLSYGVKYLPFAVLSVAGPILSLLAGIPSLALPWRTSNYPTG
jgi:hypothetical protein